jgi:hypothetical protein
MAYRQLKHVFRMGELSLSDAFASGKATWAIDCITMDQLRLEGVKRVGIWVKNTGDKYITSIEDWLTHSKIMSYAGHFGANGKEGARQHYLNAGYFIVQPGKIKIR